MKRGALKRLLPGLEAAGMELEPITFREEDAAPPLLPEPHAYDLPATFLLDELSLPLSDISVTTLGDYAACPRRFRFRFVDGHPGIGEGLAVGRRVGRLTHKALGPRPRAHLQRRGPDRRRRGGAGPVRAAALRRPRARAVARIVPPLPVRRAVRRTARRRALTING